MTADAACSLPEIETKVRHVLFLFFLSEKSGLQEVHLFLPDGKRAPRLSALLHMHLGSQPADGAGDLEIPARVLDGPRPIAADADGRAQVVIGSEQEAGAAAHGVLGDGVEPRLLARFDREIAGAVAGFQFRIGGGPGARLPFGWQREEPWIASGAPWKKLSSPTRKTPKMPRKRAAAHSCFRHFSAVRCLHDLATHHHGDAASR